MRLSIALTLALLLLLGVLLGLGVVAQGAGRSAVTLSKSSAYQPPLPYRVELHSLQKNSMGISSRYVITNEATWANATTVHEYYDESSQWITTEVSMIPPGAGQIYDLAIISSIPDGYRGYVIVSADQPITGTVLETPTPSPTPSLTPTPTATPSPTPTLTPTPTPTLTPTPSMYEHFVYLPLVLRDY